MNQLTNRPKTFEYKINKLKYQLTITSQKWLMPQRGQSSFFMGRLKDLIEKTAFLPKHSRKTFVSLEYSRDWRDSWRACYEMRFFKYKVRNYY